MLKIKKAWIYDETWYGVKLRLRRVLQRIYGFHPWHTTPVNRKDYALYLIKKLSSMNRSGTFVEVGCGLGDIVGNVSGWKGERYGFDISIEAIRCAKVIHPFVKFSMGSISDVKLGHIDVFLMVNWPQGIDDDTMREWVRILKKNNQVNMFIVDRFYFPSDSYPYCHEWGNILGDEYELSHRTWGFEAADDNRRYIEFWERKNNA